MRSTHHYRWCVERTLHDHCCFKIELELHKLEAKAEHLVIFPNRGRIVPELLHTGISQYRELISAPWRIIYRVESLRVMVMAVLDSRRDLQTVLLNRLAH